MRFRLSSPVWEYLNTAVQYIGLNLIFIVCCLPIVTIGPAIAALCQVMLRESRGEHGYLIRSFFQHFKEMFVQAALTFFLFAGLFFVLLYSLVFWHSLNGIAAAAAFAFTLVLAFYIFSGFLFAFPLMARFKNSFWKTIHNAFLLSMTNLKLTAALLLIYAVLACMAFLFPKPTEIFMIVIGFSFLTYGSSFIFNRIFKVYVASQDGNISDEI